MTRIYAGPLPTGPGPAPLNRPTGGLVDQWDLLLDEGFEGGFPASGCVVSDNSSDGEERYWGGDDYRPFGGTQAGWPAAAGADGVDPASTSYPANLDTWLICGPYDLSQAEKFMVEFNLWLEIGDTTSDGLFYGVSTDGSLFTGSNWVGQNGWIFYREHVQGAAGQSSIWVGWSFYSDDDVFNVDEGAWIDDLKVWRYNTPAAVCGDSDPGSKGMVLPAYDPTTGGTAPMIRPGDALAVAQMKAAGVHWVRLGLIHQNGSLDWRAYDRMIDTLCAEGMSVLGLVNQETILAEGYNDPGTAAVYRQQFTNQVSFITSYFQGRITYWEVWNEQNFLEGAPLSSNLYAFLLNETYQAIQNANDQAQVLFGGLASAWGDSDDYLFDTYNTFDNELGKARPFDYFAVHPYPKQDYGPNPAVYMYEELEPDEDTLIDKFLKTMFDRNDGDKHVWVTEVGWNSAKGLPNRPTCHDPVLVTEAEQAAYLKPMFDILFNEVDLWQNSGVSAIDKVIWYQYMDVGTTDPCTDGASRSHAYVPVPEMTTAQGSVDWLFGLYRSDKVTPKPVQCHYLAYPLPCHRTFLPTVYSHP